MDGSINLDPAAPGVVVLRIGDGGVSSVRQQRRWSEAVPWPTDNIFNRMDN